MYSKLIVALSALGATVAAGFTVEATWNTVYPMDVLACANKVKALPAGVYGTALSTINWDDTAHCGQKMKVTGPNGATIDAMVVDRCMGCADHGLDLNQDAFAQLANLDVGVITVHWEWA